ncbi:MAG: TetR/AcrR family transcriptional regulator C-terminal domain-containing protein [Clostridia bacterium]|nr:TetR/AcrR family transcriptional regulator C-terminal domain-containing protein [Clostridia bacterium]
MDNKRLIADTYLELLKKKNIDKITIKDIVDGCGITRQSFYYHFCDVFDLIEWIMSEGCKTVLEDTQNAENPQTATKLLLQMMFDRYDIIMSMLNSKERYTVERILIKTVREYLLNLYDKSDDIRITKYELETALDFYSFAIVGYIKGLCERKDNNIERAAEQLIRLLETKVILFNF